MSETPKASEKRTAKITKRAVDALVYQGESGAACYLWDSDLTGFGCRVYPSGRKSFVASCYVQGRRRFVVLGRYGVLTVDQARAKAQIVLAKALEGIDPAAAKTEARSGGSVRELCAAYIERHAKPKKRSWREDQRRIDQHILPAWGNRPARSITRNDAAALHSRIGKNRPFEANRTASLLHKLFALAERWGAVPQNFPNPAASIDRFPEPRRDRWITPEEMPKIAAAIDQEPNLSARFALWLYLLTGLRKTELLRARWEDIDWDRSELRLPETKAGRVHYVPLSAPALALLRQIPRLAGNPYVLPGARRGAHLVNISAPWRRVRAAAGVADVRLHDLRRTVGSWLAQSGVSLHLIGRVLGHTSPSATQIYARLSQDNVREALERHGAQIMGAAGKAPTAEIVEMTQGKKESA